MRGRRLWVARPSREQQAAHDRDVVAAFDAAEARLNAELVKAYKRIADLEAENDRLRYGKAAS